MGQTRAIDRAQRVGREILRDCQTYGSGDLRLHLSTLVCFMPRSDSIRRHCSFLSGFSISLKTNVYKCMSRMDWQTDFQNGGLGFSEVLGIESRP